MNRTNRKKGAVREIPKSRSSIAYLVLCQIAATACTTAKWGISRKREGLGQSKRKERAMIPKPCPSCRHPCEDDETCCVTYHAWISQTWRDVTRPLQRPTKPEQPKKAKELPQKLKKIDYGKEPCRSCKNLTLCMRYRLACKRLL